MRLKRFVSKWRKSRKRYVIVYDVLSPNDGIFYTYGDVEEQYYGYFLSAAEARHVWKDFTQNSIAKYENVKLCQIIEDW